MLGWLATGLVICVLVCACVVVVRTIQRRELRRQAEVKAYFAAQLLKLDEAEPIRDESDAVAAGVALGRATAARLTEWAAR
jgi:hypothetical protein